MNMAGSIDKLESGRYRLRMYVNRKQETIGVYDSEQEAARAQQAYGVTIQETASEFDGETLLDFGHNVLVKREALKKVRDPGSDWSRWNHHIKTDVIAKRALRRLDGNTPAVVQWLGRVEGKGLEPQTRRNCLTLLRVVLHQAVLVGKIKVNPARGLRIEGGDEEAWTYLRPDEQTKILNACVDEEERCMVGFAIGSGLREGEHQTLRLADVHLSGAAPHVIVRYGKRPSKPTKAKRTRKVHLFGVALEAMRRWMALLPAFAKKNPNGLAFPGPHGGFRSDFHILRWERWQALLERAAIGRDFRWHDLRHTCASSLVAGWWGRRWSLHEVMKVLGHTSITMTQRYAHLADDEIEGAAMEAAQVMASHEVTPAGLEPALSSLGNLRSFQLSYGAEGGDPSSELGKLRFARLRADLPPPDSFLTHDESSPSSEAPQPTGAGPDEVDSSTGEAPVDHSVDRALPLPAPAHWRAEELRSQARGSVLRLGGDLKSPLAGHLVDTLAAHAALYGGRVPPTILGTQAAS